MDNCGCFEIIDLKFISWLPSGWLPLSGSPAGARDLLMAGASPQKNWRQPLTTYSYLIIQLHGFKK